MKLMEKIFSFSKEKQTAHKLYHAIVQQARQPVFYEDLGVVDSVDGRFDMIILHMILVMRRLKDDVDMSRKVSQALFDYMFDDIDLNLREMGIGDMGVPKRIKKRAKAFYGRLDSYDMGLNNGENDDLKAALARNLFREGDAKPENLEIIAKYMRLESERLDKTDISSLINGDLTFGSPPPLQLTQE
jgi:cytochrome b pre-mRNA-processing protein 3